MKLVERTQPVRVQLSRRKGFRLPPNTVKVARPSLWGNPYKVGIDGDAAHCVGEYRRLLTGLPVIAWPKDKEQARRALQEAPDDIRAEEELLGRNLACWCKPGEPCHADVLLEVANRHAGDTPNT